MIGQQCRVRRSTRQRDLAPGGIDEIAVLIVGPKQSAHIADVVSQAGDDHMGIVFGRHMGVQRAAAQDVVPGQCHQHRVLDIVIERVAVADAFQRNPGDRRHHLDEMRLRRAKAAAHVVCEEFAQCVGCKLRHGNHRDCPRLSRATASGGPHTEPAYRDHVTQSLQRTRSLQAWPALLCRREATKTPDSTSAKPMT
jgi:hypothetical protein